MKTEPAPFTSNWALAAGSESQGERVSTLPKWEGSTAISYESTFDLK